MNGKDVYLHGIGTAVPENSYTQEFALDFMLRNLDARGSTGVFLKKIYRGSAIEKRHSVISDYGRDPSEYEFFTPPSLRPEPALHKRNSLYIKESGRLALKAAQNLFGSIPVVPPDRVTHLITVSCTGFSAPGFDLYLAEHLGFSEDLERFNLGFMGCYGAFPALRMAGYICSSCPGARVLIVNVELCSLHFQLKDDPDTLVANALFADGASAALVSTEIEDSGGPRFILRDFRSRVIRGTNDAMAWEIGENAFDMRLSVYVPRLIGDGILGAVSPILERAGLGFGNIRYAVHPGGKAVLDRFSEALSLEKEKLNESFSVLRDYGNMSSATVMFVLEKIRCSDGAGHVLSAAFGPGLTVETALLEKTG